MKLSSLEPKFIQYEMRDVEVDMVGRGRVVEPREHHLPVEDLGDAQGIMFDCPLCETSGQSHRIEVTFAGRNVADECGSRNSEGKPSRWNVSGSGVGDLTLTPSVWLKTGCGWHGHVTNGEISAA